MQAWLLSSGPNYTSELKGWVIDTGSARCDAWNGHVTVLAIANKDEKLIDEDAYNQTVQSAAPVLAPGGELSFTVGFRCDRTVATSEVVFSSARVALSYKTARRSIFFQNMSLPIYSQ